MTYTLRLSLLAVGLTACAAPTAPAALPPCERSRVVVVDARGVPVSTAIIVYCPDTRAGVRDTVDRSP